MSLALLLLGGVALLIWIHLVFLRGFFWLARERDARDPAPSPQVWPRVCAVVPARDEADVIAASVGALLRQDYRGPFEVILVDDASSDGTAQKAREGAAAAGALGRLRIIPGAPLPVGWTGKLWAMAQGVEAAAAARPAYVLLTDADIAHAPDTLSSLVARAEAHGLVLVSLMARLQCATLAERALIPAFVFFFDMLYPFPQVNAPASRTAAAAGGCMLANFEVLARQGGVGAIRGELIDDCAMGRLMKAAGPVWLGLTDRARSIRPYGGFLAIGRMVARSAYAQLGYSPLLLVGVLMGLGLTFLAPPLLLILAPGPARWLGGLAYLLMATSFQPMLAFYRRSPLWGLALPAIGAVYAGFTLKSALDVWRGRGGLWKGRAQARLGQV
jgi:hopene-associated glycosyltransferase HpnB